MLIFTVLRFRSTGVLRVAVFRGVLRVAVFRAAVLRAGALRVAAALRVAEVRAGVLRVAGLRDAVLRGLPGGRLFGMDHALVLCGRVRHHTYLIPYIRVGRIVAARIAWRWRDPSYRSLTMVVIRPAAEVS